MPFPVHSNFANIFAVSLQIINGAIDNSGSAGAVIVATNRSLVQIYGSTLSNGLTGVLAIGSKVIIRSSKVDVLNYLTMNLHDC